MSKLEDVLRDTLGNLALQLVQAQVIIAEQRDMLGQAQTCIKELETKCQAMPLQPVANSDSG